MTGEILKLLFSLKRIYARIHCDYRDATIFCNNSEITNVWLGFSVISYNEFYLPGLFSDLRKTIADDKVDGKGSELFLLSNTTRCC